MAVGVAHGHTRSLRSTPAQRPNSKATEVRSTEPLCSALGIKPYYRTGVEQRKGGVWWCSAAERCSRPLLAGAGLHISTRAPASLSYN
eukprot:7167424-Prymnesium_polylepis.1